MKKINKRILVSGIGTTIIGVSTLALSVGIKDYKVQDNPYVNSFKSTNSVILNYAAGQSPDTIQTQNLTLLKRELGKVIKLNNPNEKASEIVKRIVDVQTLKKETNIDLTGINNSTFAITTTSDMDGVIDLSVVMDTPGAKKPKSSPVKALINNIKTASGFGIEDDSPKHSDMYHASHTTTLNVVSNDPNSTVRADFDFATVSTRTVQPSFQELVAITNGADKDLFEEVKKRIFLSKKNGKWVDFNGLIQAKEFTSEANAIQFSAKGWGSKGMNTAILKVWISKEDAATGEVEISFNLSQTNPGGEDAIILKSLSAQGLNHEYSKDLIKAQNYEKLQKIINIAKPLSKPKGTDAEIVKKIHDLVTLKDELGIDLSGITDSTFDINSSLNSEGSVVVNIEMNTPGAREPKSKIIPIIFEESKSFNNFVILDSSPVEFWKQSTIDKTFTQEVTINKWGALRVSFDASIVNQNKSKPTVKDLLSIVNGTDKTLFSRMQKEVTLEMKNGKWIKADGVVMGSEITTKNNAIRTSFFGKGVSKTTEFVARIWVSKYDPATKKSTSFC
ncbi:hypothetical protein MYMA111404_04445 [Mycoplasma marinum]|uniref:hypothetical protein n=1 Tax=Mycoplasma marinum TaxID=1937190 RepID=UPI003B3386E7